MERGQKIVNKFIDNPWMLRITALALAILMFFSVRPSGNTIDSTNSDIKEEVLRDVPVELRYDDNNFVVTGVPQTVDVKISGPVGIVITTKTGRNIKVVANIKDQPSGTHVVKFEPEGFSDKLAVEVEPKTAKVNVEERITKDVKVEPEINEGQLADTKYVKNMTTEPETVTVSGAKSAIDRITYVKATVSASKDADKTFEKVAGIKIFDRNMNILNVDVEPKTVKVKVELSEYNKEVPLVVNQKGKPAKGYTVDGVTPKSDKVLVYGSRGNLEKIQQVVVNADVEGLKKTTTVKGTLEKPTGVADLSFAAVDVRVKVSKENETSAKNKNETDTAKKDEEDTATEDVEKTFKNINVKLQGMNITDYSAEFITPSSGQINVIAKGASKLISALTTADIQAFADASKIDDGIQELPIQVKSSEGIELTPSLDQIKVRFTKQD